MKLRLALLVLMVVVVFPAASATAQQINGFVGFDTGGKFDLGAIHVDSKNGYHLGAEALVDLPLLDFGVGFEYGVPRSPKNSSGDMNYKLIYGVARMSVLGPIYVTGRYGYANVSVDKIISAKGKNGNSWALGAGLKLAEKVKVEALFTHMTIGLIYETYSANLVYTF
jgi:opacity protein-like surface antigen